MGGKILPRIRLTSAKVLVEVEAEVGNSASDSLRQTASFPKMPWLAAVFSSLNLSTKLGIKRDKMNR